MALSNWDTLAIDLEGKSIDGTFISPAGVNVQFYKNWIYVYDKKAWRKCDFTNSCVMKIDKGEVHYIDVVIKAIRGPQNGIYAVVTNGWEHDNTLTGMVGCGVYGYDDEEWIGVTEDSKKFLQNFISGAHISTREEVIDELKHQRIYKFGGGEPEIKTNQYDECIKDGSLESYIDIYMEPDYEFCKKIRELKFDGALRFNQGDAFFAAHYNSNIPLTKIGEAVQPLITTFIKKLGE